MGEPSGIEVDARLGAEGEGLDVQTGAEQLEGGAILPGSKFDHGRQLSVPNRPAEWTE